MLGWAGFDKNILVTVSEVGWLAIQGWWVGYTLHIMGTWVGCEGFLV